MAIATALVVRVVFWAYTDRVWEDSLITIKHVRNAVDGIGLIHHPGEGHVQGFTSALSVLVPLPAELVHHGAALTALRLVSLAAAVVAIVYANRIARRLELSRAATAFVLAYLAVDHHQVLYGMAGMETEIAVAVLLAGGWYVLDGRARVAGPLLGLALLARPDFILWVVPALAWFGWRRSGRSLVQALAGTVAVAGPWFVFTCLYYGSPVPETIKAKAVTYGTLPSLGAGPGTWLDYLWDQPGKEAHLWKLFAPFLSDGRVLHAPVRPLLEVFAFALIALACAGAWRLRAVRGFRPLLVFAGLYALYAVYGGNVDFFAWYLQPPLAVIALLTGAGLTWLGERVPRASTPVVAALVTAIVVPFAFALPLERHYQHSLEEKVRAQVGRYLAQAVAPGQTVSSESAGYVGWYANFRLYDYPGLASPAALRVVKTIPRRQRDRLFGYAPMAVRLHADWIVARDFELQRMADIDPKFFDDYREAAHFAVRLKDVGLKEGALRWGAIDQSFYVLRRAGVRPAR